MVQISTSLLEGSGQTAVIHSWNGMDASADMRTLCAPASGRIAQHEAGKPTLTRCSNHRGTAESLSSGCALAREADSPLRPWAS